MTAKLATLGRSVVQAERSEGGAVVVLGQVVLALCGLGLYEVAHTLGGDRRNAALAHAASVLHFERWMHADWEQDLQAHLVHDATLRGLFNVVYAWTYWPVILGALIFLWFRDRRRFAILRDAMFIAGAVGLLVFITFPVAPPRMLPGFLDTISPSSAAYSVVHGSVADPFAALPSFHAGWVAIAAVVAALGTSHRRLTLPLAIAVSVAMSLAVVATANHYVVDAVSGILLCGLAGLVATHLHPPVGQGSVPGRVGLPAPVQQCA